jgi:hemin uptake protein HemP
MLDVVPEPKATLRPGDAASVPAWRSEDLLAGAQEAWIVHAEAVYRLRLTAQGKLILTK